MIPGMFWGILYIYKLADEFLWIHKMFSQALIAIMLLLTLFSWNKTMDNRSDEK